MVCSLKMPSRPTRCNSPRRPNICKSKEVTTRWGHSLGYLLHDVWKISGICLGDGWEVFSHCCSLFFFAFSWFLRLKLALRVLTFFLESGPLGRLRGGFPRVPWGRFCDFTQGFSMKIVSIYNRLHETEWMFNTFFCIFVWGCSLKVWLIDQKPTMTHFIMVWHIWMLKTLVLDAFVGKSTVNTMFFAFVFLEGGEALIGVAQLFFFIVYLHFKRTP